MATQGDDCQNSQALSAPRRAGTGLT